MFSFLTACASSSPVAKKRFFWPSPPGEPKIEWLATYYSDVDLRGSSSFMNNLLGEQSEVSFSVPVFIGGNSVDKVVVSDMGRGGFIVMDLAKKTFYMLGDEVMAGMVSKPTGIAFDDKGLIYAGDTVSRKVYVVNNENKVVSVLDLSADIKSIGAFAIDKKRGHLIVPDARENKVVIFSLDGRLLHSFGRHGGRDGEFNDPIAVALDGKGDIYVTDSFNARIQIFSSEGVFKSKFGKRGDGAGDFGIIKGVALDSDGHVYVMDARYHNMQIFNSKGEILMAVGGPYSQHQDSPIVPGGFVLPQGIFIDVFDRIYVADLANHRIQSFQYMNENELRKYRLAEDQGLQRGIPAK